jgi:hypothetical protein
MRRTYRRKILRRDACAIIDDLDGIQAVVLAPHLCVSGGARHAPMDVAPASSAFSTSSLIAARKSGTTCAPARRCTSARASGAMRGAVSMMGLDANASSASTSTC